MSGEGTAENASTAAHYFKVLAGHGFIEGHVFYGDCLAKGDAVAVDRSLAAHYYKLAADQGPSSSPLTVVSCFDPSWHVPQSLLPNTWLALAQSLSSFDSSRYDGHGVSVDKARAAHYFKLSADHGLACSQVDYGRRLFGGEGLVFRRIDHLLLTILNWRKIRAMLKLSGFTGFLWQMAMV